MHRIIYRNLHDNFMFQYKFIVYNKCVLIAIYTNYWRKKFREYFLPVSYVHATKKTSITVGYWTIRKRIYFPKTVDMGPFILTQMCHILLLSLILFP